MCDFEFYKGTFGGGSLDEEEFLRYAREARAELDRFERRYTLTPVDENARPNAVCQIAEVLAYFDWLENGGTRGLSVGSVSQTGGGGGLLKKDKAAEVRRAVGLYYDIYRGPVGGGV